jgi:K+-transporting ATPase KdpF subunit
MRSVGESTGPTLGTCFRKTSRGFCRGPRSDEKSPRAGVDDFLTLSPRRLTGRARAVRLRCRPENIRPRSAHLPATMETIVISLIALACFIYLIVAVLRPEKF